MILTGVREGNGGCWQRRNRARYDQRPHEITGASSLRKGQSAPCDLHGTRRSLSRLQRVASSGGLASRAFQARNRDRESNAPYGKPHCLGKHHSFEGRDQCQSQNRNQQSKSFQIHSGGRDS
jgi:hypothetical protein